MSLAARPRAARVSPAGRSLLPSDRMIRRLAILALAVLPLSCRDKEEPLRTDLFADVCAQIFSCTCDEYPFADANQCEQVYAVQYAGIAASAEAAGLTVDDECIKSDSDEVFELGCKTPSEYFNDDAPPDDGPPQCSYCSTAYGTVAAGQPCLDYGEFSDCARGLLCHAGACLDPCAPIAAGQPCLDVPGTCAEGLFCNFELDRCEPPAQLGESCETTYCAADLVCTFDGNAYTCEQAAGPGEPCDFESCQPGLDCVFDPNGDTATCQTPAGAGESCEFKTCADDLFCNDDGMGGYVCGTPPKVGETCTFTCVDGAYCDYDGVDGVCKPLPGEGQPCIEFECTIGFECSEDEICVAEEPLICGY